VLPILKPAVRVIDLDAVDYIDDSFWDRAF
jgi:hypothetical protein